MEEENEHFWKIINKEWGSTAACIFYPIFHCGKWLQTIYVLKKEILEFLAQNSASYNGVCTKYINVHTPGFEKLTTALKSN